MNGQSFREHFNTSTSVEETVKDANIMVVDSDPSADNIPVDAALITETPVGETDVAVSPMDEELVHEELRGETIPSNAPVAEAIAEESSEWVTKPIPTITPLVDTVAPEAPISMNTGSLAALLNREESEHYRTRWNEIQGKFVDEPRSAVEQADALVSEVIAQITQVFANEHHTLEGQWNQGNDVSTEDFRKTLQHYRSFFNRLVI
jgi:hypothetical protein